MAGFIPIEPKRRVVQVPDRASREGMTGMGFQTQRHFIDVKEKMNNYLDEQQGLQDRSPAPPAHQFAEGFLQANKSPSKSLSSHSTSSGATGKHESHGGSTSHRKHQSHVGASTARKPEGHTESPKLARTHRGGKN